MQAKVAKYTLEINNWQPKSPVELEAFRQRFLSKNGLVNLLAEELKALPGSEKKVLGKLFNDFKQLVSAQFERYRDQFALPQSNEAAAIDISLPGDPICFGSRHPLSLVRKEIIGIFARQGFALAFGPEVEDDYHIFSALNFPPEHPARDMQDTFFIDSDLKDSKGGNYALRTHTSSVQIRLMENSKPPFRALMPGRVFRNEAVSARSHCIFHQVEGLYVAENVSFADLKQCLYYFVKEMYGASCKLRFRPSYFPFTEPSAEMDIACLICQGRGCNVCKQTGWVEILGCGMVDPQVLLNCKIDPEKYSGFAFGMGIERITMLKYGIKDLRLFFENDVRFLQQFAQQ